MDRTEELTPLIKNFRKSEIRSFLYKQRENVTQNYTSLFYDEKDLKVWFVNNFQQWFDIYPDIPGFVKHHEENEKIEADFIIAPKLELKEAGFEGYWGIEVKFINPKKDFCEKSPKTIFQGISYSYSDIAWELSNLNQQVKTSAFLMFTNLSFETERDVVFETHDRFYDIFWKAMFAVANHADLGELVINNSKQDLNSWRAYFAGSNYCAWSKSKGFLIKNKNVISKRRIGHIP